LPLPPNLRFLLAGIDARPRGTGRNVRPQVAAVLPLVASSRSRQRRSFCPAKSACSLVTKGTDVAPVSVCRCLIVLTAHPRGYGPNGEHRSYRSIATRDTPTMTAATLMSKGYADWHAPCRPQSIPAPQCYPRAGVKWRAQPEPSPYRRWVATWRFPPSAGRNHLHCKAIDQFRDELQLGPSCIVEPALTIAEFLPKQSENRPLDRVTASTAC
jgi:hypothetical protein